MREADQPRGGDVVLAGARPALRERMTRQKRVQSTSTMARMTLLTPVPSPTIRISERITGGNDIQTSTSAADDPVDPAAEIAGDERQDRCRAASRRSRRGRRRRARRARRRSGATARSGPACRCRAETPPIAARAQAGGSSVLSRSCSCGSCGASYGANSATQRDRRRSARSPTTTRGLARQRRMAARVRGIMPPPSASGSARGRARPRRR